MTHKTSGFSEKLVPYDQSCHSPESSTFLLSTNRTPNFMCEPVTFSRRTLLHGVS